MRQTDIVPILGFFSIIAIGGCDGVGGDAVLTGSPSGIVGGTETNFETWKGVVALVSDEGLCSGALIAPRVVLTAGHCVKLAGSGWGEPSYDYTADPSGLTVGCINTIGSFLVGESIKITVHKNRSIPFCANFCIAP